MKPKKMYNLDEENKDCLAGHKEFCFWHGKKAENVFFSDVRRDSSIYLFLTLCTAESKHQDYSIFFLENWKFHLKVQ